MAFASLRHECQDHFVSVQWSNCTDKTSDYTPIQKSRGVESELMLSARGKCQKESSKEGAADDAA